MPDAGEVQPLLWIWWTGASSESRHRVPDQGRGRVGDGDDIVTSSRWPRPSPIRGRVLGPAGLRDLEEAAVALDPAPQPPCSSGRTVGRRRWPRPCAALVVSWSPVVASRSRPSWPRSTGRASTTQRSTNARTASSGSPHRRGGRTPTSATASRAGSLALAAPGTSLPGAGAPVPGAAPAAPADMIQKSSGPRGVKDQGILTEEEFAAQNAISWALSGHPPIRSRAPHRGRPDRDGDAWTARRPG